MRSVILVPVFDLLFFYKTERKSLSPISNCIPMLKDRVKKGEPLV